MMDINYRTVETFEEGICREAVKLHVEALSYRSFVTFFGVGFLLEIYRAIFEEKLGFMVCAEEEGVLRGFVLGLTRSAGLMPAVRRRWLRFVGHMAIPLLTKRGLLSKVYQTLCYGQKTDADISAELLIIAVTLQGRGQGIGKLLVKKLEDGFVARGISSYKVTVHQEMDGANRFYFQVGMGLAKSFELYGVRWNMYVKHFKRN